jgi:hypothetical protein
MRGMFHPAHGSVGELKQLTHNSGKKQKKLEKYPMLCLQF